MAPPETVSHLEELQVSGCPPPPLVSGEDNEFRAMRREIAECMAEIRSFRKEMAEFRTTFGGICQRLDVLEQRMDGFEQLNLTTEKKGIAELEDSIAQLKLELNDREQEALLADLDIGGLPEEKGENIVHTIIVLGTKLGVQLEEKDIVFAERVGALQYDTDAGSNAKRTRRVIVRLARRHLRDEVIRAARVRRHLISSDMDLAGASQRVYLNERLTRINRVLFHRAREECRKRNWRYSWTKKGRVYVRENEGKRAYAIRTDSDFSNVFGNNNV